MLGDSWAGWAAGAEAGYLEKIVPLLKPGPDPGGVPRRACSSWSRTRNWARPKGRGQVSDSEAKGHLAAFVGAFQGRGPLGETQSGLERAVQGYLEATGVTFKVLAQPNGWPSPGHGQSRLFRKRRCLARDRVLSRMDRAVAL
jgi:hypothetical protein